MPAPKGNDFWKLRSKHGRDTLFENPELLKETAEEYFSWCKKHPLLKMEKGEVITTTGKDGKIYKRTQLVGIPTARPFNLVGFRLYIGCSQSYFINFKHILRTRIANEEGKFTQEAVQKAEDFLTVIGQIEDICYTQKIEGAMVGAYNANIVQRDLGLREQIDAQVTGNIHLSKEPITFE